MSNITASHSRFAMSAMNGEMWVRRNPRIILFNLRNWEAEKEKEKEEEDEEERRRRRRRRKEGRV